ncbi:MAG TPA: DHH family phosphoesterase [archaeon]|nr:DHH family phosphoesterase [archaeon]
MLEDVVEGIKNLRGSSFLILTHHNADADALGSALALKLSLEQLAYKVSVGAAESINRSSKKITEGYSILIDPDCKKFDRVILMDTSVPEQLASVKNLRADIVIDHHPPGKLAENAITYIDTNSKSISQMTLKIIRRFGITLDYEISKFLAVGLITETAFFRLADLDVLETLVELLKNGVKFEELLKMLDNPPAVSDSIAALKAANRAEAYRIGDMLVVFSTLSSHEAPAARALVRMGADVAVVAAKQNSELRISSRAKQTAIDRGIDLVPIFREVGEIIEGSGGGHPMAGSANGKSKNLKKALKHISKEISKQIGREIEKIDL